MFPHGYFPSSYFSQSFFPGETGGPVAVVPIAYVVGQVSSGESVVWSAVTSESVGGPV